MSKFENEIDIIKWCKLAINGDVLITKLECTTKAKTKIKYVAGKNYKKTQMEKLKGET